METYQLAVSQTWFETSPAVERKTVLDNKSKRNP